VRAVPLEPAFASADAPLQRPCGVREVQGERADRRFDRHMVQDGIGRQDRHRRAQRVAADVAQEDPCPDRVPRQEGERDRGDRGARGEQERVRAPRPEAAVRHASDKGMRGRDTVHAVHEVERVDDPGSPHGGSGSGDGQPDRRRRQRADEHAGGDDARGALQHEPLANRQPGQILGEPDRGEERDRDAERCGGHAVHERRGHEESRGDRCATPPQCGDGVRRPQAGNVDR
jgi:hypothetical protein